jgi:hypothetical protein
VEYVDGSIMTMTNRKVRLLLLIVAATLMFAVTSVTQKTVTKQGVPTDTQKDEKPSKDMVTTYQYKDKSGKRYPVYQTPQREVLL